MDNTTIIRKLVTFVFKYRPIGQSYSCRVPLKQELTLFFEAVLMADGIAPKEKNTRWKPLADPTDIIDLTLDNEMHARCKRGPKPSENPNVAAKTEIKKERSITFDTEVIDLTT